MPVTMRYSASLDRPYEDGSEMNRDRQTSTSTEQPYSPGSESYSAELWNDVQRNKNNLELGFSDSMDSLGLDDDSQSSASGHSRHHSSDGGNSSSPAYSTRPLATLTPKPSHLNPLQFVKTITSPLVKKAEEQIKQYEEVKKVKELVKEEAEEWQSNLDGWKSRRRLVSQKSVQRVEEVKQIEEEVERSKRKSKTFSEMMEERSKRGVTKPLPTVYSDDSFSIDAPPLAVEEDFDSFTHNEDSKFEEKIVEDSQNVQNLTSNNGHDKDDINMLSNIIEVNDNKEKITTDTAIIENDEVKIDDDVLSLQINNAQDTKVIEEDIKEINQREPGQVLEFSIQFRRHMERKDFGFSLKNVKGIGTEVFIEAIQEQSPAALAGLNVNDEVIAINGEQCFQERSFSAIVFAIKQALHTGQLQLVVYRYQNPVSVLQNQKLPEVKDETNHSKESAVEILPKVDVKKRRSLFEQPAIPERAVLNRRSLDLSNNIIGKVASFENSAAKYKSSEFLNVDDEVNKNGFKKIIEDLNAQVGSSGLKYGFELASTLQETPIVNSPPHSPLDKRQMDTLLNFDLIKDEDLVIVNYDPLTAPENGLTSPEPPKEKPPPPPPLPTGDVKLRRVESTKRILKEIHKRRSNFLGIEDDEFQQQIEQQMSQVSPPPNVDEMLLKMERERFALNTTSSDSDISFEKEIDATLFSPTNSSSTYQDDIDQREQEIIENSEWEEEQKFNVCGNGLSAAEILSSEVPKPSTAVKVVLGQSVGNEHSPQNKGKSLEEKELELKEQEERLRGEKEKLRREQEELLRRKKEYEEEIQRSQSQQLRSEKEKIRREQEELVQRKKEYEEEIQRSQSQQFQMQQKKSVVVESQDMGVQKMMTPSLVTVNVLQTTSAIVPGIKQLPPPILTKPKPNEDTSLSSMENTSPASLSQFQILSKPNLVALSAPPKAKLMDGEEWLQKKKRENYHQHWLVQEAEFRRLQAAQAKDSVKSRSGDDRLLHESSLSARHVNEIKSSQHHTNGSSVQEHLLKLAPRPPAKPSFPISTSSNNNNRSSNSQLSPNANSSLHNQSSSNISDSGDFQMLSVSGKKRCSHCGIELGRGAAMIIESLHLYYHIGCFKCCVCHIQLGNGTSGTDVRVRSQKLHCHNCYSNDKGLKFSKV